MINNIEPSSEIQEKPVKKRSDLDTLWAIRDIPKSILNAQQKGILAMFVAIIGMNKSYKCSMPYLEDKLGITERRAREHFHYLEDCGFLTIIRPENYRKGKVNEYIVCHEEIIKAANRFREQKLGGRNVRQCKKDKI